MKRQKTDAGFATLIRSQSTRMYRVATRQEQGVWFGCGVTALFCSLVVAPTLIGAAVGYCLDGGHAAAYTVALLIGGLVFGCLAGFFWVTAESIAMWEREEEAFG